MAALVLTTDRIIWQNTEPVSNNLYDDRIGLATLLGSFEIPFALNVTLNNYDTGISIAAWDAFWNNPPAVRFTYYTKLTGDDDPAFTFQYWGWNADIPNVSWGWYYGHSTKGSWARTRWSGPHRLVVSGLRFRSNLADLEVLTPTSRAPLTFVIQAWRPARFP